MKAWPRRCTAAVTAAGSKDTFLDQLQNERRIQFFTSYLTEAKRQTVDG
jgi:hypothetical protein